jgi:hypothetical protein
MLELAVLLIAISTVPTVYATVFASEILSTGDCDISHDFIELKDPSKSKRSL